MLFKKDILDKISSGEVTLAFRLWRRPTVKASGRLRTPIGDLAIVSIRPIDLTDITDASAEAAGYIGVVDALSDLSARSRDDNAVLYEIAFRLAGADTRTALREHVPTGDEMNALQKRIAGMETRRGHPWVMPILERIAAKPGVRAAELAASVGRPVVPFKADVRKLKDLGLTISLDVGYQLSPRGRAILDIHDTMSGRQSR